MKKYNKLQVSTQEYQEIKDIQIGNKVGLTEHYVGSRKKLFSRSMLIATTSVESNLDLGGITAKQFYSFLGGFNRSLYSQFKKNPKLFDLKIEFKGTSRSKNLKQWDSMKPGVYFYNVDLSSAYWQIAYKLGYISKEVFTTYMPVDEYKEAKRYCVSFLARKNKMVYNTLDGSYEIKCDTKCLQTVYDNIRNELYNTIQDSLSGIKNYIEYNIDGVSVMAEDLNKVKEVFKSKELEFKVSEYRKINNLEYAFGGSIRKFKNK